MQEHTVVRKKTVVWVFDACDSCGRVHSWFAKPKILEEK